MKNRETPPATGAEFVTWNLDDLVAPPADEGIETLLADAERRVAQFAARYRGKVAGSRRRGDAHPADGVRGRSSRWSARRRAMRRFHGRRRATILPAAPCCRRLRRSNPACRRRPLFLDLEWANAPDEAARRLIDDPLLSRWRHWLIISRRYKPHLLSEPEEKILAEKSVTGRQAWMRYLDETLSAKLYEWEGKQVPQEVILRQLYEPERETCGARPRHPSPGAARHPAHHDIRHEYAPGGEVVGGQFAPLPRVDQLPQHGQPGRRCDGERARHGRDRPLRHRCALLPAEEEAPRAGRAFRLRPLRGPSGRPSGDSPGTRRAPRCSRAYGSFHPRMAEIASLFFEKRWIDASVHPGKRGGAFSSSTIPSVHPYILMSFQGTAQDVMTLAHELGHGVHQYLARDRGVLQQNTPLTTAETASVFGETLVFQRPHLRGRRTRRSSCPCSCARSNPRSRPSSARWR